MLEARVRIHREVREQPRARRRVPGQRLQPLGAGGHRREVARILEVDQELGMRQRRGGQRGDDAPLQRGGLVGSTEACQRAGHAHVGLGSRAQAGGAPIAGQRPLVAMTRHPRGVRWRRRRRPHQGVRLPRPRRRRARVLANEPLQGRERRRRIVGAVVVQADAGHCLARLELAQEPSRRRVAGTRAPGPFALPGDDAVVGVLVGRHEQQQIQRGVARASLAGAVEQRERRGRRPPGGRRIRLEEDQTGAQVRGRRGLRGREGPR